MIFNFLLYNGSKKYYEDNGPILIECRTLCSVVSYTAESETHGTFNNDKQALPIIYKLGQLRHKQLHPTPIHTDNSTSVGFVNRNMQTKMSKTWNMHLHWIQDKENKKFSDTIVHL